MKLHNPGREAVYAFERKMKGLRKGRVIAYGIGTIVRDGLDVDGVQQYKYQKRRKRGGRKS